ncbi:MAG: recombination mediator RecR [Patescibacteria group bacterium]
MRIPKAIINLIESFERLPGVGPKSAQRLTFYLLHVPQGELDKFASSVQSLKKDTVLCSVCFSIGETDPCSICGDNERDKSTICVVEEPLDVLSLERNGRYHGVYHVLHGRIDPLNNIGPDEIYIRQFLDRIKKNSNGTADVKIKEVILATNPTMEGEATAMYIAKQLRELITNNEKRITITRIGRGLPVGADLEYADEVTLQRAMEGRQVYE